MNCPECGKPMEKGVLSYVGGGLMQRPRWYGEGENELLRRELDLIGTGYDFYGFRCRDCKTLVVKY